MKFLLLVFSFFAVSCSHHDHHQSKKHKGHHGLRHDFSDAKYWAKKFDDPTRKNWQKPMEVVGLMELGPKTIVADIGAGTGYFLPFLDQAVKPSGTVLAMDISQSLIDHMDERIQKEGLSQTKTKLIGIDGPGLSSKSADRILIVNTWHHISSRIAYSTQLRKALKTGGSVFIVDYEPEAGGPGPRKNHRLPKEKIMAELKAGGLQPEVLNESLPYQYIIKARK